MITDEKIKEIIMSNSREWIKDVLEDVAILRVEDFIEELQSELKKLRVGDVSVSVCSHEWIVNTHQKTKYCRKGCDGFKEQNEH